MADPTADAPEPDVMDFYDAEGDGALTCRICGSLVSGHGDYPRAHGDGHEASTGA